MWIFKRKPKEVEIRWGWQRQSCKRNEIPIPVCDKCGSRNVVLECAKCSAFVCLAHLTDSSLCDICKIELKLNTEADENQQYLREQFGIKEVWAITGSAPAPVTVVYGDGHSEPKTWKQLDELQM